MGRISGKMENLDLFGTHVHRDCPVDLDSVIEGRIQCRFHGEVPSKRVAGNACEEAVLVESGSEDEGYMVKITTKEVKPAISTMGKSFDEGSSKALSSCKGSKDRLIGKQSMVMAGTNAVFRNHTYSLKTIDESTVPIAQGSVSLVAPSLGEAIEATGLTTGGVSSDLEGKDVHENAGHEVLMISSKLQTVLGSEVRAAETYGLHNSDCGVDVVPTNSCNSLTEGSGLESKITGLGSRFHVLAEDSSEDIEVEVSKAIT